jgi:hypothetical protein
MQKPPFEYESGMQNGAGNAGEEMPHNNIKVCIVDCHGEV